MAVARARGGASTGSGRSSASARGRGKPAPNLGASSLLGRGRELVELAGLLDEARLITLTGAPGIGKSRLAVELAGAVSERFAAGAHVVELAPVTRPVGVARALAAALKVDEVAGGRLTDTIIARLSKRRLLLVLDNCEHLLGACAKLIEALLAGCPEVRILATSREPLGVEGEVVWLVPPLAVPDREHEASPEALARYAAVGLFVERAGTAEPGFSLNAYLAPAVAEICRRLDGIPLAIELAAARVESLTPAEIARRLDDRFGLLNEGGAGGSPRHETLEAALEWSHDLLSEPERALLRRLSVFLGGFDLAAAEAVCADGEVERGQVPEPLASLVGKSLVVADAGSPAPRYRLLETIRTYAGERLQAAGEAAELRRAHAGFYLALAERAEPELTGPGQNRWLERLEAERPDLRSALEWSLGHGEIEHALRLAGALVLFWRVRCHFSEGRELLDATVSASHDGTAPALMAKALWGSGFLAMMAGDSEGAVPTLDQSVALFRALDDRRGLARALMVRASARQQHRDESSVLSLLEESAALAREVGDAWCLAHALGVAGIAHAYRDELALARGLFEEGIAVAREVEDKQGLRFALLGLGAVALRQSNFGEAKPVLEEALAVTVELGEDYSRATALRDLGQCAWEQGDDARARELLEEALDLFRETRPAELIAPLLARACVARAEGDLGHARRLSEDALARARAGAPGLPLALQGMGELAAEEGDERVARRLFEEALDLARPAGDKRGVARALYCLGQLAHSEGDFKRAAVLYDESLQLQHEVGHGPGIAASLEAIGALAAAGGRGEHAARLLGAAQTLREATGWARAPGKSTRHQADIALARESRSIAELEAAFTEGRGLSIEQAVIEASKHRGLGRPRDGLPSLTETERQVAALAAEGMTNPEIAEALFVSLGTVKSHLSRIFSKLGVARRTELARELSRDGQPHGTGRPTPKRPPTSNPKEVRAQKK